MCLCVCVVVCILVIFWKSPQNARYCHTQLNHNCSCEILLHTSTIECVIWIKKNFLLFKLTNRQTDAQHTKCKIIQPAQPVDCVFEKCSKFDNAKWNTRNFAFDFEFEFVAVTRIESNPYSKNFKLPSLQVNWIFFLFTRWRVDRVWNNAK